MSATTSDRAAAPAARRRRGDELCRAIHEAVLAEMNEVGFDALTVEGVADRAHTGKASIYRRWPTKVELVVDALDHLMPTADEIPDTGHVRDDLLVLLRRIAATMNGDAGGAARVCLMSMGRDELAELARARLIEPRRQRIVELLRRGVERGQVRPEAATARIAEVGPAMLHAEVMQRGRISDAAVVAVVDEVLVPLLRPGQP